MNVTLHVPTLKELRYRERLLSDKATMSYNKGYNLDFPGYDSETGCITFPKDKWEEWFAHWIVGYPERFYAYIRNENLDFVGEVKLEKDSENTYSMGIVVHNKHRGKGYAEKALEMLLKTAFQELGAVEVHNNFEKNSKVALKAHLKCGFEIEREQDGIIYLTAKRTNKRKTLGT